MEERENLEKLQAELQGVHNQIELLNREREKYQAFCSALDSKQDIGTLAVSYLRKVTVNADKRIIVLLNS